MYATFRHVLTELSDSSVCVNDEGISKSKLIGTYNHYTITVVELVVEL